MDPLYVFEGYTIDEPWVIVLALAHNYERLKQVPSDETNGVGVTDNRRSVRAGYASFLRARQLDPLPGIQRRRISWTFRRCPAFDPAGHCLRPGRTGQARFIDQPALRIGCASCRCHDRLCPWWPLRPTASALTNSARPARFARTRVPLAQSANRSSWCAVWSAGMWTSISASHTSPNRHHVGSA
jgi:hypothetical protein